MDKILSLFISCNSITKLCTNPKPHLTSLEEVYIVEEIEYWVTQKTLALPHSWPLVFPKVTHGMSPGPPKMHIWLIYIFGKIQLWLFNYFHLFLILSFSDFCTYLDLSPSGEMFSKLLCIHKLILHSSYAHLKYSFVNLHHDWCHCLVQVSA